MKFRMTYFNISVAVNTAGINNGRFTWQTEWQEKWKRQKLLLSSLIISIEFDDTVLLTKNSENIKWGNFMEPVYAKKLHTAVYQEAWQK